MTDRYGQDVIDDIREAAGTLPSNRCKFFAPLQCIYNSGDNEYCSCHYQGKYWPHITLKDYERNYRHDEAP